MNEFTAKELEFRSKHTEALKMASDRLRSNATLASVALGDLRRAAVEVIDIAHDAVERTEAENAALKKQLEGRPADGKRLYTRQDEFNRDLLIEEISQLRAALEKSETARLEWQERYKVEASDANDWRMLQDRLTRLTAANGRLIHREAQLMDCVRWYANWQNWGTERANACLRSLGLLDTDERSGEGC